MRTRSGSPMIFPQGPLANRIYWPKPVSGASFLDALSEMRADAFRKSPREIHFPCGEWVCLWSHHRRINFMLFQDVHSAAKRADDEGETLVMDN